MPRLLLWFAMEDAIEVILQEHSGAPPSSKPHPVLSASLAALLTGVYGVWTVFTMPGSRIPWRLKVPAVFFESVIKLPVFQFFPATLSKS